MVNALRQIPVFAKEYQVITVDLAGHGHSSLDRSEFSMLSFANDVKAIIEKEKIDRAILIGHSKGGGVIAEVSVAMELEVSIVSVDVQRIFRQGALTNILNPRVAVFFMVFIPQFISADSPNKVISLLFLGFVFITTGTLWRLLIALFSSILSRRIRRYTSISRYLL